MSPVLSIADGSKPQRFRWADIRSSTSLSASTTDNKTARQVRQDEKLPEFRLILNPTDGSEVAELATRHAICLAKLTGAELLILHVVETTFTWYTGSLYQQLVDELRDFAGKVIERAVEMAGEEGVEARSMIVDGHSGTAIVRIAEREKADMIVMGALGRTMVEETLVGSISQYVIRHAPCAVLVVK
jgi:nucleotide-binding universal stress UspA family protein